MNNPEQPTQFNPPEEPETKNNQPPQSSPTQPDVATPNDLKKIKLLGRIVMALGLIVGAGLALITVSIPLALVGVALILIGYGLIQHRLIAYVAFGMVSLYIAWLFLDALYLTLMVIYFLLEAMASGRDNLGGLGLIFNTRSTIGVLIIFAAFGVVVWAWRTLYTLRVRRLFFLSDKG